MEFLEYCNPMHRKMTLSALSRLIENPKSVNYFCDWNSSKTMINSTRLLVKIYNEEDKRYGVKYQNGILLNKERPLNPQTAPWVNENMNLSRQASRLQNEKDEEADMKEKLAQIANSGAGTEAFLVKKMNKYLEEVDLRAIIFAILYRTGFDKNEL